MITKLYKDTVEVDFKDSSHRYKVNDKLKVGVSTVINVLSKDLMDWAAYMAVGAFREAVEDFCLTDKKMTKIGLKQASDEARKAHRQKSQKGMDVGSIVHAWIKEEIDAGKTLDSCQYVTEVLASKLDKADNPEDILRLTEEATANEKTASLCVQQWRQWVVDYGIEFIKCEQIVYSKKLDYCGTFDCLFRSRRTGKLYLGDYKTSEPQKIKNSKYQTIGHKAYPEHFVQISGYDYAHFEETAIDPDAYMVIYLPKESSYQVFSREEVESDRQNWEHLFRVYEWLKNIRKDK